MKLNVIIAAIVMAVAGHPASAQVPVNADRQSIEAATGLPNPLRTSWATTTEENADLRTALTRFAARKSSDDLSALRAYATDHPRSGWTTSVLVNIGDIEIGNGYFTRAISAWEAAWSLGGNSVDRNTKLLVDHAIGNLVHMRQTFGQFGEVDKILSRIRDRPIEGSATEVFQVAREVRSLVDTDPRHLYTCGPKSLSYLLAIRGRGNRSLLELQSYRAGPDGTSLSDLEELASKHGMKSRVVRWSPGQEIPQNAVVHWKAGHFAAVVGVRPDYILIRDPAFPRGLRMSRGAFEEESSGYMLVPDDGARRSTLPPVAQAIASTIKGKGPVSGMDWGGIGDFMAGLLDREGCPLCGSNIKEAAVAVTIRDTPVGYAPATGPSIFATIAYNQRNDWQTPVLPYANLGQKWSFSWNRFINDSGAPGSYADTRVTGNDTAAALYDYNSATKAYSPQVDDGSILRVVSITPIVYERTTADGSIERYSTSDNGNPYRRVYITSITDPQGNSVTFNYQGVVLKSVTDQYGRQTTVTTDASQRITRIEDPFGRAATFTYDANGRLASITDVLGLTSSFQYDANSLVKTMTTPYGTTNYRYTAPGTSTAPRFVEIEDPLGNRMREEWIDNVIPDTEPTSMVPTGMSGTPKNDYLKYRNSFHWNKDAYLAAGCTPTGGCDYSKARVVHFEHNALTLDIKSTAVESVKQPLENRVYMLYPGQITNTNAGTFYSPSSAGRVVAGSVSQVGNVTYDAAGYYKTLTTTDPAGRLTTYAYAANRIDLLSVKRTVAGTAQQTLMQATYDANHNPLTITDAAGQVTTYTYNTRGQPLTVQDAIGNTTWFAYDALGRLTTVTNANNQTAAAYTYDALDRVATMTDSEGWTVSYQYDAANRPTRVTYPDGSAEIYVYNRLDLVRQTNRIGQTWKYVYDANSRITSYVNPQGQAINVEYTPAGHVSALIDARGNRTEWFYDIQGRPTQKKYADATTVSYAYDPASGLLSSETDALGQIKQYAYAVDDQIAGVSYANAINPTPSVTFAYDPYYSRPTSMTDGTGTTNYAYHTVGSLGALQLATETIPSSAATNSYGYDALGRLATRSTSEGTTETYAYDALSRMTTHVSALGSFGYSYLGQTGQVTSRTLAGTSLGTAWAYGSNIMDRRLTGVSNTGLSSGQTTAFTFQTDAIGRLMGMEQVSDATVSLPTASTQAAQYNALNQQTVLDGQAITYDANGNQTSDGQRTYGWDAEGRLLSIGYPGQPGKATTFTYDGLGRRTSIASTPTGGGPTVDRRFAWCGDEICQSRTPTGGMLREYLAEGENVGGNGALLYGIDNQGSVRRAFSATSAPSYDYDPYGLPLQTGIPATDFGYAGLMSLPEAGIQLSSTRPYNPGVGRWLRRDMAGEQADSDANLYGYANKDPSNLIDPWGYAGKKIIEDAASGGIEGLVTGLGKGLSDWDYTFCEFGQTIRAGLGGAASEAASSAEFAIASKASGRITGYVTGATRRTVPQVTLNKAAGDAYEADVIANVLPKTQANIRPQITIKSNGPSGLRVRLDALGSDIATGTTRLSDMKASGTAPFTPNQAVVYPELERYGGVVVGKGKAPYTGGTKIAPTAVDVIRKTP